MEKTKALIVRARSRADALRTSDTPTALLLHDLASWLDHFYNFQHDTQRKCDVVSMALTRTVDEWKRADWDRPTELDVMLRNALILNWIERGDPIVWRAPMESL